MKKYEFTPDYTNIVKAASNQWVDRMPLYEHIIGGRTMQDCIGVNPFDTCFSSDRAESVEGFKQLWNFWRTMGYDTASMEFGVCGALINGGALGNHKDGCIKDRADFERYPWHEIKARFFEMNTPFMEDFAATCPAGMKAIGGVANGVFEAVQDLVGYIDLCYIKADDEELYQDIFKKMGELEYEIWDEFMDKYADVFCVMRFGDDLGFKNQTLISAEDIRENIIPVYSKIITKVHSKGKPFLLHSCGCIFDVMEDLIGTAKINAKHSNEDQIGHFSVWVDKYGDRIGNFGGIDTDVLCRYSPSDIREYVLDCLSRVKGKGGIAFASGNSIPDYVPLEGYMAMVDTVREWRGDKLI